MSIALLILLLISSACFFRQNKTYVELNRILEAGNEGYRAKQYDKAIEYYDKGLKISSQELALLNK